MSFLSELKRRNVIRMAGLYLVGAWLIVQIAETLLPIFKTPDWVLQTLVVLLAIGFIPALVFSWVFELTPDGLKRDGEVKPDASIAAQTGRRMEKLILGGMVAVVLLIAADRLWPGAAGTGPGSLTAPTDQASAQNSRAVSEPDPVPAAPAASPAGIAVLPFVNMSADEDNSYFSDGISEELLNVLVRVDGLDVASRTSSFAYKGSQLGTRRIAEELRVSYLLEGSVRKSGNQVRITAQLIDAANDRHLWSETYDRDLTDIFVIQDEIANAIVTAMREELPDATVAPVGVQADTDNLPAYESYLKGRELFIARTDLAESIRLFERAVELDPDFARGWEGLAAVYAVADSWKMTGADFYTLADKAARRALELDASLSMPWAALALAEGDNLPADYGLALEYMHKAITADPHNATAYLWRGILWQNLGFFDRARADMDACLAIDPVYPNCIRWKAVVLLQTDRKQALALFELGVARDFIQNRATDVLPAMHARGDRIGVRLLMKEAGFTPGLAERMVMALDNPKAVGRLTPEEAQEIGPLVDLPILHLWLGDEDSLEKSEALIRADTIIAWQLVRPEWRNTPSFKRLLTRLGLVTYWRKHGFPPQCRAIGSDDFECDPPNVS